MGADNTFGETNFNPGKKMSPVPAEHIAILNAVVSENLTIDPVTIDWQYFYTESTGSFWFHGDNHSVFIYPEINRISIHAANCKNEIVDDLKGFLKEHKLKLTVK